MKTKLISLILIISSYNKTIAQDTIPVKKFVYVQYNKYHPLHKVRCKYITFKDGKYYVKGRELKMLRHTNNDIVFTP